MPSAASVVGPGAALGIEGIGDGAAAPLADPTLERLHRTVPAARCLPLLAAIAMGDESRVAVDLDPGQALRLRVRPCV